MNKRFFSLILVASIITTVFCQAAHHEPIYIYGQRTNDLIAGASLGVTGACLLLVGQLGFNVGGHTNFGARAGVHAGAQVNAPQWIVSGLGAASVGGALYYLLRGPQLYVTLSDEGIAYKYGSMIRWEDIADIECVLFTTIQFGEPLCSSYIVNVQSKSGIPMSIEGRSLAVNATYFMQQISHFYDKPVTVKKETVHDTTPRPTNVNVYR